MDAQRSSEEQRADTAAQQLEEPQLNPLDDMLDYFRQYARENPEIAALTCLGVGFALGWKLKPW